MFRSSLPVARSYLGAVRSRCYARHSGISEVVPDYTALIYNQEAGVTRETGRVTLATLTSAYNTASVTLRVNTGSRFETEENNGASHFLQHLAFNSKAKNAPTIGEAFEKLGASVSVSNSREQLAYTVSVDGRDINAAISILGEMVNSLSDLTQEQVEQVRPRALEHQKAAVACKYKRSMDHLHSIIYQKDTLGLAKEGKAENLRKLDAATLSQFASENFTNERMVLAVAGNFDGKDLQETVSEAFPLDRNPKPAPNPTAQYYGSVVTDRDDTTDDVLVTVGYEGLSQTANNYYPLAIVKELVGDYCKYSGAGNNHSGRLAEYLATEKLCDSFTTFNQCYSDVGVFGITMASQGKYLDDLVGGVVAEFVRLAHNARPGEVVRAKDKLINKVLARHNGPDALSNDIALYTMLGVVPPNLSDVINNIDSVSVDHVRAVCSEHFMDVEPAVVGIGSTRNVPDYNQVRGWTHWWRV